MPNIRWEFDNGVTVEADHKTVRLSSNPGGSFQSGIELVFDKESARDLYNILRDFLANA